MSGQRNLIHFGNYLVAVEDLHVGLGLGPGPGLASELPAETWRRVRYGFVTARYIVTSIDRVMLASEI